MQSSLSVQSIVSIAKRKAQIWTRSNKYLFLHNYGTFNNFGYHAVFALSLNLSYKRHIVLHYYISMHVLWITSIPPKVMQH